MPTKGDRQRRFWLKVERVVMVGPSRGGRQPLPRRTALASFNLRYGRRRPFAGALLVSAQITIALTALFALGMALEGHWNSLVLILFAAGVAGVGKIWFFAYNHYARNSNDPTTEGLSEAPRWDGSAG